MHPVQPLRSREEQDRDFFDEYSRRPALWPLVALVILVAVVLVAVWIWG